MIKFVVQIPVDSKCMDRHVESNDAEITTLGGHNVRDDYDCGDVFELWQSFDTYEEAEEAELEATEELIELGFFDTEESDS